MRPDCRTLATQVIAGVIQQQASLATLLPAALAQTKVNDQSLLQELCYGTLRHFYSLDARVSKHLAKPLREKDSDIHALLLVGAYQLLHTRIPAYAAINSSVNVAVALKKIWAKALVNAVLRKVQAEADKSLENSDADEESRYDHPQWLIDTIRAAWPTEANGILVANNSRAPMTLRINQQQTSRVDYLRELTKQSISAKATFISDDGIQLDIPVAVDVLPGFATGRASVQDEAAQLCAHLLKLEKNQRVLDACAAPGGKTGHLLETEPSIQLIALDIDEDRCALIRENLQRLQLSAKALTANASQPESWWQQACESKKFDRILLDAPCSATGVIRHHPDIKLLRRAEDIPAMAETQLRLLNALWPLLSENGLLLYATCSVLPQENDEVIEKFLALTADAMTEALDVSWGLATKQGRQLFPVVNEHDGFYYVRLKKQIKSE
jgi:16S rRNA (cytosine967-C5)-methyltransferase